MGSTADGSLDAAAGLEVLMVSVQVRPLFDSFERGGLKR